MRISITNKLILAAFFLASCAQANLSFTPPVITSTATSTEAPTLRATTAILQTTTITLPPTATPLPKPTATPTISPTPTPNSLLENTAQLVEVVTAKLNDGQEISEITTELDEKEISLKSISVDFDDDGVEELFVTGTMLQGEWLRTTFWIVSQSQDDYKVVYALHPEMFLYAGHIYDLGDLNGDELPDVLVASYGYGNGCGEYLFVLGWRSTKYMSYSGYTEQCIDNVEVGEIDELVLTSHEGCWASSGPGRDVKEYFQQNDTEYVLSRSEILPDNYRIHVLADAQRAYDNGNDALAIQFWEQAARDLSLTNYPSTRIEDDKPEIYQPAFALYRLYTYYVAINDKTKALQYLQELRDLVGDEKSPGGELLILANEAKKLLDASKDSEVVCTGIYDYLNSTDENVAFLMDHWYWGSLNDGVDFCPLPRN